MPQPRSTLRIGFIICTETNLLATFGCAYFPHHALIGYARRGTLSIPAAAQPVSSGLLDQRKQAACSFLKSLHSPSLGLVRTTPNGSIYYIASDNLVVEKAISSCDATTSNAINQSISSCCDRGNDRMHEALLGVKIHLPIDTSTVYTIANSTSGKLFRGISPSTAGGNYTVLREVHNATGTFPDCTYADVTVYNALELRQEGNTTGMQHEMDCLTSMFDGRGIVDEGYKAGSASDMESTRHTSSHSTSTRSRKSQEHSSTESKRTSSDYKAQMAASTQATTRSEPTPEHRRTPRQPLSL